MLDSIIAVLPILLGHSILGYATYRIHRSDPESYDGYEGARSWLAIIGVITLLSIGLLVALASGARGFGVFTGFGLMLFTVVAMVRMTNRQETLRLELDQDEDWTTAQSIVRDPLSNMRPDDTAQTVAVFKAMQKARGNDICTLQIAQIMRRCSGVPS